MFCKMSLNIKNYNEVSDFVQKTNPSATFIAVTKNRTIEEIEDLINLGHLHFGENRAQEAMEKFLVLKQKYPRIVLHFIGSLQSNKVRDLVKVVDVFHSLDSFSTIDQFAKCDPTIIEQKTFFAQINIANEPQKGGVLVNELSEFLSYSKQKNVNITGLMTIPPENESRLQNNNICGYFAFCKKISFDFNLKFVSMGMSSDFKQALQLGSTHIRVGSFLFNT
jgi:pyridoxal phosphate enzyme (YggS family)